MRHTVWLAAGVIAFAGPTQVLEAQSSPILARAIEAHRVLDLERSVGLIRRWFDESREEPVAHADRLTAFAYLAAGELLLGRGDSADAAFERLVLEDPRYQLDDLIFPPPILNRFDHVRRRTPVTAVRVTDRATVRPDHDLFEVHIHASTPHRIVAHLTNQDGETFRALYAGPVGDSVALGWDGRDTSGELPGAGHLFLNVESFGEAGSVRWVRQIRLDIRPTERDTLLHPPYPDAALLLPEKRDAGPAVRTLLGAVALGAFAASAPSLLGAGDATDARFVVGGTVSVVGIVGFVLRRPGQALPENIAHNRGVLSQWQDRRSMVIRENRSRIRDVRFQIEAHPSVLIERENDA